MIDANVLVAGIGWPRFAYEVLQHALQEDFQLVLTRYVMDEAREHVERILGLDFHTSLEAFFLNCPYELVETPQQDELSANTELVRDLEDLPIALAAINANVDLFISQDKDFTDPQNVQLHERLVVQLPGTFLRLHMGWSSDALEAIRGRTWSDFSPPVSE